LLRSSLQKLYIVIVLAICFVQQNATAQSYEINNIELSGLVKNDEAYIRNFITLEKGSLLSNDQLEIVRQQVIRRTGVANVMTTIDTISGSHVDITFHIEEQRTLLPQLGVGRIEGNFCWK